MRQEIFVAFVGFLGIAHAGILAYGPQAAAIHGGLYAAGERELAGIARVRAVIPAFKVGGSVERLWRDVFELGSLVFELGVLFCVLGHAASSPAMILPGKQGRKSRYLGSELL